MSSVFGRCVLAGLVLFACGSPALGDTYTDPSGFSFDYPDGWVPVTWAAVDKGNRGLTDELRVWLSKNNVDLNRISVMLLRAGRDEFLENLNVVVEGQQVLVDDNTVKQLTGQLTQQFGAMNAKVENLQGRVQKVGTRDAAVLEWQVRMPGAPHVLRQKQVLFPGGGKTYIVTCTAKADSFDAYQPTFDRILTSFQIPAPVAQGFDWNRLLSSALMWGGLGGIAGAVIGGLGWFTKKRTRPAKPEREQ